jgi:hypothetical protein
MSSTLSDMMWVARRYDACDSGHGENIYKWVENVQDKYTVPGTPPDEILK